MIDNYYFVIKPIFGLYDINYSICYYTKDCNHLICVEVCGTYESANSHLEYYLVHDNCYFNKDLTEKYCSI